MILDGAVDPTAWADNASPLSTFVRAGSDLSAAAVVQDFLRCHALRRRPSTSWMPVYDGDGSPHGWTLDMMRRRDGFRPVVEFMIASSCLALREDGARFLSLSGAPLARTDTTETPTVLDRILDQLGATMEPYYGFRSLHAFKAKFQPRHEPMFLLYRDEADLPRIGLSLLRCYMPSATMRDLLKLPAHQG